MSDEPTEYFPDYDDIFGSEEWSVGFNAGVEYVRAEIDLLKTRGVTDIETIIKHLKTNHE